MEIRSLLSPRHRQSSMRRSVLRILGSNKNQNQHSGWFHFRWSRSRRPNTVWYSVSWRFTPFRSVLLFLFLETGWKIYLRGYWRINRRGQSLYVSHLNNFLSRSFNTTTIPTNSDKRNIRNKKLSRSRPLKLLFIIEAPCGRVWKKSRVNLHKWIGVQISLLEIIIKLQCFARQLNSRALTAAARWCWRVVRRRSIAILVEKCFRCVQTFVKAPRFRVAISVVADELSPPVLVAAAERQADQHQQARIQRFKTHFVKSSCLFTVSS